MLYKFKTTNVNIFYLLIVIFFSNYSISQIKNVEIKYELGLEDNKGNYKRISDINYTLVANQSSSRFELLPTMNSDLSKFNEKYIYLTGAFGVFYTTENEIIQQVTDFSTNKPYRISTPNNNEWKILNEVKYIEDFKCIKAVLIHTKYHPDLNRNVSVETHAWFTPEIPIPFGPANYNGLPGLILQVKPLGAKFYFTAIEINKTTKAIVEPLEGEKLTEEEFTNQVVMNNKNRQ